MDANSVKIAVVMPGSPGKLAQFLEMDHNKPLTSAIEIICTTWDITDPENYILRSFDVKNQCYITESNKLDIKPGSILRLELSPEKNVQDILTAINMNSTFEQYAALAKLSYLSLDLMFAEEFIKQDGLNLVTNNIVQGKYKDNALRYALITFIDCMNHGIVNWDELDDQFIEKIVNYVERQPTTQDKKVIECCLTILEKIILNSSKNLQIEKKLTINNLLQNLQTLKQDYKFQQSVIAVINAIFIKADTTRKMIIAGILSSKQCRSIMQENLMSANESTKDVIKKPSGNELIHQLYVLQTLVLNLLEPKMKIRADAEEQESQEKIKELKNIVSGGDKVTLRHPTGNGSKTDTENLDLNCVEDQINYFNVVPPGVLALDCMLYFATNYSKDCRNIVHKNNSKVEDHQYPIGKACVELVKLLCEILQIGKSPSEQGLDYYPMIFKHKMPFEEMFSICMILFNKMWDVTKATKDDIPKVIFIVREQLNKALSSSPKDFNEFREKVNHRPYAEITKLWQRIRNSCRKKVGNFV